MCDSEPEKGEEEAEAKQVRDGGRGGEGYREGKVWGLGGSGVKGQGGVRVGPDLLGVSQIVQGS